MSNSTDQNNKPEIQPERYALRIQGYLSAHRLEWLGCQKLVYSTTGETTLTCQVPDQAALHGLLANIRDMNLKLISVTRLDSAPPENEHI